MTVEPQDIPGAAIEPVEKYVDEFSSKNAAILSGFKASMYRTQPEGSAQTWVSGAVNAVRWLSKNYEMTVTEASQSDLDDYLEYISGEYESTETIAGRLDGLKHLYRWLERKGEVESNPVDGLEWVDYGLSKGKTRQAEELDLEEDYIAISREEVQQLWQDENIPSPALRNKIAIKLLWFTGVRASELARVKIDKNIDRNEGRIRIYAPKTDDYRDVWYPKNRLKLNLTEWLDYGKREALSPYAEESDYLLLTHQSEKMRAEHISRIVKDAAKNAGINEVMYNDANGNKRWKITGHTLRHSFATYHANKLETPIHILQDVMGHKKIETTRKYISEDKEAQRKAMQEPWE